MDSSFAGFPASSFSESLARRGMSLRLETTISGSRQTMRISFIRIAAETLPLAPTLATRKNPTFCCGCSGENSSAVGNSPFFRPFAVASRKSRIGIVRRPVGL